MTYFISKNISNTCVTINFSTNRFLLQSNRYALVRRLISVDNNFDDPAYKKIDLKFNDGKVAYRNKTTAELIRAYVVFQLCSINYIVDKNKEFLRFTKKIFGDRIFEKLMKLSFYGHFVAGVNVQDIKPLVERNMKFGVKSILDYSVEKDITTEEAKKAEIKGLGNAPLNTLSNDDVGKIFQSSYELGDRREHVVSARTYFYEDETQCDENMKIFMDGIKAVSGATGATGFSAIKLTALGRPQLLIQLSEVLTRIRKYFDDMVRGYGTGTLRRKDFERHLKSFNLDAAETEKWFTILDVTNDGEIDLLDWHNLLEVNVSLAKLLRVPNLEKGVFEPLVNSLDENEMDQMKNMLRRVDILINFAKDKDVRVMIDAEQTYFQAAINRLCMEMMRKYNKEKAYIFNTYQAYLKDTQKVIRNDLALSAREDFYFGAKLVRGAYIEQERLRASTLGYEDPICRSVEATTKNYENIVVDVMKEINKRPKGRIAVMMATHNEDSIRFTIEKMKEYGIKSTDKLICFGQLLGMSDQISFSLGQAGYSIYKYMPYGPVAEVMPYLSRRATENKGMLAKVKKEKSTDCDSALIPLLCVHG